MRIETKTKSKMAAVFAAMLILLATITALRAGGYGGWDAAAAQAMADSRAELWTRIGRFVNDMGSTAAIGVVTLLSAACWRMLRTWKIAIAFFGVVLLAYALQTALKAAFAWERPEGAWGIAYDGYGYPSGNATIAAALYGWWFLLGLLELRSRAGKLLVCAAAIVIVVATVWSRLYFGVHYLSDVAAGCCVGGMCALAGAFICSWRRRY